MQDRLKDFVVYVAKYNPEGVNQLAIENRMHTPKSLEGRIGFLSTKILKDKDAALLEIAKIHPDKPLISKVFSAVSSNADGGAMETVLQPIIKKDYSPSNSVTNFLLFVVLVILLLSILGVGNKII